MPDWWYDPKQRESAEKALQEKINNTRNQKSKQYQTNLKNKSGWGGNDTITPELQKKVLDEMFEQRKYRNRRH